MTNTWFQLIFMKIVSFFCFLYFNWLVWFFTLVFSINSKKKKKKICSITKQIGAIVYFTQLYFLFLYSIWFKCVLIMIETKPYAIDALCLLSLANNKTLTETEYEDRQHTTNRNVNYFYFFFFFFLAHTIKDWPEIFFNEIAAYKTLENT